eukprot:167061-Chlamydomonas_euryale.AAC.2
MQISWCWNDRRHHGQLGERRGGGKQCQSATQDVIRAAVCSVSPRGESGAWLHAVELVGTTRRTHTPASTAVFASTRADLSPEPTSRDSQLLMRALHESQFLIRANFSSKLLHTLAHS